MAESPQERSPGVFSRIGSWLAWGWSGPVLSGDDPDSETQASEEDDGGTHETHSPAVDETVPAENSPSPRRNAKHPRTQVSREQRRSEDDETAVRRSHSLESSRSRSTPDFSDQDNTEQMARRRSGRRRRGSHGDVGGAKTKSPTNPQPDSPVATSLATSPQSACADSAFEEAEDSVQECTGSEAAHSCRREDFVRGEWVETHLSEDKADSPSSPVAASNMDEEPVVRKTESAESKRRSIKVSHSEKIFAKKLLVSNEDPQVTLKSTADPKWPRSDEKARCPEDRVDNANVKSSQQKGRIADKISLFERGAPKAVSSSTNLRHLDISPARIGAIRLKEDAGPRSSSAAPKQTVKERAMNFTAGQRGEKLTLSSGHALNERHSKTAGRNEASCSGSFEKSTANTSEEPKPIDQTDSKSHNATQSEPALSESTSDSNIGNKELDKASCSAPTVSSPIDETLEVKSPNRTGSRSKKRRSKEPLSPTSKNKQEMGQGEREVKDNKRNTASNTTPKPLIDTGDVAKTTDQCVKSTSGDEVASKQPKCSPKLEKAGDLMQSTKATSNTDLKELEKTPHMDTEGPKEMKSMDEKEGENRSYFETQVETTAYKASGNSSNEVNTERTGIDSKTEEQKKNSNKKQPVQESSEGEGRKNRDTIVNTLFRESGKLDPSVTNEEKPPSPEDLKAANSKDVFVPANSSNASSRKDAMRNRESETDMLVLPEKDTTTCVHKAKNTTENDPKSDEAQRPSKPNHKSKEKDSLTEIINQSTGQLKTTETHTNSSEVNTSKPTEQNIDGEITTKTTKQGKPKDSLAVKPKEIKEEGTIIIATSQSKETQNTEKNSSTELNDQTKEQDASTSRALAISNPALVKTQNDKERGGPKRDGPQSQSESREASSKRELQQQQKTSTEAKDRGTDKTKSKIISTDIASTVNGDTNSAETEDNTFPVIPTNSENLSLRSVKKKPTSSSSTANEGSVKQSGQAGEKITSKPASTNETVSSDDKSTTLGLPKEKNTTSDSANEKTPQASTNETTSTLPALTTEKAKPPPASTLETTSTSLGSSDKPPSASTNDRNKTPSDTANKSTTNENTTSPQASTNKTTSTLPASTNEKNTTPSDSINEKTTPPGATLPPASTDEIISSLPASTDVKITPQSDSAKRKTNDEKTMHPLTSTNEKAKSPPPASTNETMSTLLAKTIENTTPPTASAKEKTTPLPQSTMEITSTFLGSTNEKTTPSPPSTVKSTSTLLGSGDYKTTVLTNEAPKTPPDSTNKETTPPPASTNERASTLPASTNKKSSTKENAPPPATTDSPVSNDKTTTNSLQPVSPPFPLPSTNGGNITPLPSSKENKTPSDSANENTTSPQASTNKPTSTLPALTNEKNTALPSSFKEKTLPPDASTKEKISHTLPSASEKSPSPSGKSTDPATRKKEFIPKPFLLPKFPFAPGSSSLNSDSPSSWLDVDMQGPKKKKQLISAPKPKPTTSVRKTNLDTSGGTDLNDLIANVKRLAMPFNLPQRKHNHHRPQAPPFALPVIKEDRYENEKPFDPEEFACGLRRRREFILDLAPSSVSKSQDTEAKEEDYKPRLTKLKRESILTRSLIFQRARKEDEKEEGEKVKGSDESKTEPLKTKSRLERCSIVSLLGSRKGRRMEFLSPTECPSDGLLSPNDAPGSTSAPQSQLAPTAESPKQVMIEKVLAKNDGRSTLSGSQVILKPSKDVVPAMIPDLKTTSRDQTVTAVTDTKAPPSDTKTGSQVVLKPSKDVVPAMIPDLKTTLRDPTVNMLTDTNEPPSDTKTDSQVVLKPTKEDGPMQTPDLKTTSLDPQVTMLKDTNSPATPGCAQSGSQVVLKHSKNDGPIMTPDLKTTLRDPTVTMVTDTNEPPSDTKTGSQVVLKPTKEDGPVQTPDLKTTSSDPQVTMLTDTNYLPTLSYTQSDGPTMTPDLKTTLRDPTVTMLTDSNALLHPSGTQTTSQVVLKPTKDDGPSLTPDQVNKLKDIKTPPLLSTIQTGSDVVLQPDGPTLMPDLKTTTVDPIVTLKTDASAPPPFPSFEDIKLPSFLEKFLPKEPENTRSSNTIDPLVARESASIPGLVDLNTAVGVADGKTQDVTIPPAPQVPEAQIPQAKPQRELPNIPTYRGIHRRPAKIVIFEHHQFNGQSFEFFRHQPDATQVQLSSVISVKVVRGCWILYEKPGFEGRCIALEEESVKELPNQWAEEGEESSVPMVIGSIRLAIRDYTPPRIELFTEPTGRGRSSEYVDATEEVGSFSLPQDTGSIKVHSGLWLVYSDPGFQGMLAVMEAGEYPFPEDWGFPSPIVGSLRPLRMGLPKVENPTAVKAVLYENAGLQGRCVEVQGDVFSFSDPDEHGLSCVESLKILGGLWVGYEREGFDGHQFILEEGEYLDWSDWGGTGQKLLSLRPVFMDFSSPHMKMFSELDFSERGVSLDLQEPLESASDTQYGAHTRSIEVLAGVWVAFEDARLCGRQYVLEKGLYGSPEDWGATDSRISSVIPVTLENLENSCHFQIELFSEPGFGGTSVVLQDSLPRMPEEFIVRSCRVNTGSWLAFGCKFFSGHQCVLEEGVYPDLRTMGFTQPDASVLSVQHIGHEFSLPSIALFERPGLRGRRTVLKSSSVNLQLTESWTRVSSILVEGGMWVLYEASNFRGSQFLLKPGAVPDWPKLSSWRRIGSLRPLMQKQPLFRLRNEEAGLMMSVTGSLDDIKLMRIQGSEERGGADQIWAYQDGRLQCKWLLDCCVSVASGVLMPGSRAVLSSEFGKPHQIWSITSDGVIRSHSAPNLVLEVKGGQQFDKSQIILNEFNPHKMNQRWSLEIL